MDVALAPVDRDAARRARARRRRRSASSSVAVSSRRIRRRRAPTCTCVPWYSTAAHAGRESRAWAGLAGRSRSRSARTAIGPRAVAITLWPPMNRATNAVRGALNTSRGVAGLLDPAAVHHHHEVGERHRLVLAVGDVDEGDAELLLQALQLDAHLARAGTGRAPRAARRAAAPAAR